MAADYKCLIFERRGDVAFITLNRPEAFNALNVEAARELDAAARTVEHDLSVRCVLLRGAGKSFCAGGDVKSFHAHAVRGGEEGIEAYIEEVTVYLHRAIARLVRCATPTVAAIQGSAAGGGMSLGLSCDFVLAAESARFTMAYTRIGLAPDGSSTYFLPRIIGMRKTFELALTNRVLSAQEAEALGLINRVVPDDRLAAEAEALAAELAAGPTASFRKTKQLLHASVSNTLEAQLDLECRTISGLGRTHDGQEGVAAFVEKRKPAFTGV